MKYILIIHVRENGEIKLTVPRNGNMRDIRDVLASLWDQTSDEMEVETVVAKRMPEGIWKSRKNWAAEGDL